MAWESKEEEAMYLVRLHMSVMQEKRKKELSDLHYRLIFPQHGNAWSNLKWTSSWGVTMVTMWDEEHLLKNIKYAMILEMLGLGPQIYCVFTNWMPSFEKRLMLLMNYLPHQKMCFYPPKVILRKPFQHSPWREIGQAIINRRLRLKNPIFKAVFYTQQYMVFLKTGIYETSSWI